MGYTTREFYTTTYHGDSVPESSFDKFNDRSADEIDWLTFERLVDVVTIVDGGIVSTLDDRTTLKVQKCACALIDSLYALDTASQAANSQAESNVKSKSSGGESISYGTADTAVTKALESENDRRDYLYQIASRYLAGTGLMYAGVEHGRCIL